LTYNQTGGYDHSVFDTFVQLTEGRSARDQPKQPLAKKNSAKNNFKESKQTLSHPTSRNILSENQHACSGLAEK